MNLNVEYAHEEDEGEIIHGLLIAACVLNFVALAADILVVACRCYCLAKLCNSFGLSLSID